MRILPCLVVFHLSISCLFLPLHGNDTFGKFCLFQYLTGTFVPIAATHPCIKQGALSGEIGPSQEPAKRFRTGAKRLKRRCLIEVVCSNVESEMDFDVNAEMARLKAQTRAIRKPYYRKRSRLDSYAGELLQLRQAGCSIAELTRWLRQERRHKVDRSTVSRWLKKHG